MIRHIFLKRKNNIGSMVDIVSVWKVLSVFCIMFLLIIGCGEPNLDDPKIREKIIAEAIDWDNLQTRRSPSGEELRYAPNQEQPYTGWVKSDSQDIINDIDDSENESISGIISHLHVGHPGDMELVQYQRGKLHGFYINWRDSNQQNFLRGAFLNGKLHGLVTIWYENGQKLVEGTCKNGKGDGRWTRWHKNGQKAVEVTYKNGELHGLVTVSHENGQKLVEGTYKNGKEDGRVTVWHENGQIGEEGTYKNGKEDGLWNAWHENGQKWKKGIYKNEKRDGLWIEWDENGEEVSRKTYKDGNVVP